jgi:hypothetical protein
MFPLYTLGLEAGSAFFLRGNNHLFSGRHEDRSMDIVRPDSLLFSLNVENDLNIAVSQ